MSLLAPYNLHFWLNQFSQSQIVIGDKAPYFFSDSELYSIVGYKYLHGDLPTNLHPEVPPLGKILIGTSIFVLNNQNVISFIFALCNLILFYVLGRYLRLPRKWTLLGLLILVLDVQYWDLGTSAMLDMFLLTFLLVAFLSFYRGLKNSRWFWLSSLFLGFMASTKLYFTSIIAVAILIFATVLTGSFKKFNQYLISLTAYAIGFMLPYISSFLHGLSLLDFLRFQRWLTSWWAGNSKIPFGGILSIIFLNQWHTWWGKKDIIPVSNWNIFWPITAFLSVFSLFAKKNILLLVIVFWIFGYLIFLCITSPFPRYLLLLFPFWILLALKSIHETFVWLNHLQRRY